jgi:predicted aldo/keto reductase-like oxidoreductase
VKYRELGQTGEKVSVLGFGAMRFPVIDGKSHCIDKKEATAMLEYGIEHGINYIDTGYPYHRNENGEDETGESESFLGEFLSTGYRENVLISTKMPSWEIQRKEDMEYFFNFQLQRLNVDQIDVYHIHSLKRNYWEKLSKFGVLDFLDDIKSDGRAKHIGFSFHDDLDFLLEVLEEYDWEVVQIQMNYIDENYQAGLSGLQYIKALGIGNIIMEPLRGGTLVNNLPDDIINIFNQSKVKRSPVEWAFSYLYNMEEVDMVLSGMSSLSQVKENIEIASKSQPNSLTNDDKNILKEVAMVYREKRGNDCTMCGYCMPCPFNVDIPKCFNEYNNAKMFNDFKLGKNSYIHLISEENRASKCTECDECIGMCPEQINIPDELKKVKNAFEN